MKTINLLETLRDAEDDAHGRAFKVYRSPWCKFWDASTAAKIEQRFSLARVLGEVSE